MHSLRLFCAKIQLGQECINQNIKERIEKHEVLDYHSFSILVFEIQDAYINSNTMKKTNKRDGDVSRCFWFRKLDMSI